MRSGISPRGSGEDTHLGRPARACARRLVSEVFGLPHLLSEQAADNPGFSRPHRCAALPTIDVTKMAFSARCCGCISAYGTKQTLASSHRRFSLLNRRASLFAFRNSLLRRVGNLPPTPANDWFKVDQKFENSPRIEKSLFFSLLAGNLTVETGSRATASATTHSS